MTQGKTTPEERKRYIEAERKADESYQGSGRRLPADMSFIDRVGNIIRPSREEHYARKKKHEESRDYDPRSQSGYTPIIIAVLGLFAGLFFLSPVVTGNAIGNLTNSTTTGLGAALIVLGLIGVYFYKKK